MIPALLALSVLWSPVLVDCVGMPESGVEYEMAYMYRDGSGTFFVRLLTRETRWDTEIGSDPPPVDAAYWYEVRADHDGAGNPGGC